MRRVLIAAIAAALAVAAVLIVRDREPAAPAPPLAGSWVGEYSLGGPGEIALEISARGTVAVLGVGHADAQPISLSATQEQLRFSLPGRPTALAFAGVVTGAGISGTVRQGARIGTFSLRRGQSPAMLARGTFQVGDAQQAVVDDDYGPARLVELDSGRVRAVGTGTGGSLPIGSGFAATTPVTGMIRIAADGGTIGGEAARRITLRQIEVLFDSNGTTLSGTFTVPPGAGLHPAVAFVHGSGDTGRSYLPELAAMLVRHGLAVLTYDKRGIGQSDGDYPGESPTAEAIDTLAIDAAAAARWLAAQPEVDPARVGLAGHSQAGWIAPLAATREPAIRFLVLFSGPVVTADENDRFQTLAGEGARPPELSADQIDAEVLRLGPGGVDPVPWIKALTIPAVWFLGGRDLITPSHLSERLLKPIAAEPGRDFTIIDLPDANHALVETQTGLTSEMLRSGTYAPTFFRQVGVWLADRGLGSR